MRFILNSKQYNTETATVICNGSMKIETYSRILGCSIFPTHTGTLYRTKNGTYFFVFKGDYDKYTMKLVTELEAKNFIAKNDYDKYVELFGEMEEG